MFLEARTMGGVMLPGQKENMIGLVLVLVLSLTHSLTHLWKVRRALRKSSRAGLGAASVSLHAARKTSSGGGV